MSARAKACLRVARDVLQARIGEACEHEAPAWFSARRVEITAKCMDLGKVFGWPQRDVMTMLDVIFEVCTVTTSAGVFRLTGERFGP